MSNYFDFTSYLKANPLPTGTYIVNGGQKTGKTGFMVAVEKTDWSFHGATRKALAEQHIAKLNAIPQTPKYDLHCPEHLYWSRSNVILHSKPLLQTHRCDISKMALPDAKYVTQYFPRYSFIIQPEYESLLDSREYKKNEGLKNNVFGLVKYAGHNFMTVMLDGQSFDRGDIYIRRLATDIFYIIKFELIYEEEPTELYHKRVERAKKYYKLGFTKSYKKPAKRQRCIGAEWTFTWIKNQVRNHIVELREEGVEASYSDYFKLCKFRFEGDDIRKCYNAFEGEAYFLHGIKDYEVESQLDYSLDRQSVDMFNKAVPRKYEQIAKDE